MMIDKGKLSLEIASFEGIAPSQTDVQQVVVGGMTGVITVLDLWICVLVFRFKIIFNLKTS